MTRHGVKPAPRSIAQDSSAAVMSYPGADVEFAACGLGLSSAPVADSRTAEPASGRPRPWRPVDAAVQHPI
jgi:hypothetical protein